MLHGKTWQGQVIRYTPYIVVGIILIILPLFVNPYIKDMLTKILIYTIFAMSLNLLWGYTGLPSLGHAVYFGVGGYTFGILAVNYGVENFWWGAFLAVVVATIVAAIFGIIALRVKGLLFLMVTLALGELLASLVARLRHITGGHYGMTAIPSPNIGIDWTALSYYYFAFIVFAICFFLLYRIIGSPFGHVLQGIREDEARMRTLGYNTWLYKYIAFIVSGAFAGIAGVLLASWTHHMTPAHIAIQTSVLGFLLVILGGAGTLYGPLIGSGAVIIIETIAGIYFPDRWPLVLGIIFVVAVMALRGGIYPHLANIWKKVGLRYSYENIKGQDTTEKPR